MSSINEVNKTTSCLGEALLNAIRLAVREEITEALIQGRFSFDDRLLNTEEASKVLQVSPDWLYRNSRKLPFTRKVGAKALRFFYRGIQTLIRRDVGLVLQGWYLEWRPIFPDNRERVLHLRRKRPATKGFPFCSVKETLIEDCGTIKARPQSPTLK